MVVGILRRYTLGITKDCILNSHQAKICENTFLLKPMGNDLIRYVKLFTFSHALFFKNFYMYSERFLQRVPGQR